MTFINTIIFFASIFCAGISWRAATYYFHIEQNNMAWIMIIVSATNAATAAAIIL